MSDRAPASLHIGGVIDDVEAFIQAIKAEDESVGEWDGGRDLVTIQNVLKERIAAKETFGVYGREVRSAMFDSLESWLTANGFSWVRYSDGCSGCWDPCIDWYTPAGGSGAAPSSENTVSMIDSAAINKVITRINLTDAQCVRAIRKIMWEALPPELPPISVLYPEDITW